MHKVKRLKEEITVLRENQIKQSRILVEHIGFLFAKTFLGVSDGVFTGISMELLHGDEIHDALIWISSKERSLPGLEKEIYVCINTTELTVTLTIDQIKVFVDVDLLLYIPHILSRISDRTRQMVYVPTGAPK
jgi:hypothetical protein